MGFKTQKRTFKLVKQEFADKRCDLEIANKHDEFELTEEQIRDLTNGQIPIEMWKKMMQWLIGEDEKQWLK